MSVEAGTIVDWYRTRREARAPMINQMQKIRDAYNGDFVLPLPELRRNEQASVCNLVKQGINQDATRAGSVVPTLYCPPTKPGIQASINNADVRRRTMVGWWEMNHFKRVQYRRLRHLIGYGMSPVLVKPDFDREIPTWQAWDPLSTFPCPTTDLDDMLPHDVIRAFVQPFSWLQSMYPGQVTGLAGADKARPDDLFECLEYVDDVDRVVVVIGKVQPTTSQRLWTPTELGQSTYSGAPYKELLRVPNRAGRCPVVVPGRITLDRLQGKYDGMLPIYVKRARLAALEEIAIEKGVWENEWFVADSEQGDIIVEADGRMGTVGHVVGGKMEWHTTNVSQAVSLAQDRFERQERVEGSIPAEFGGESASNVRTDRRGNSILGVSQDSSMIETHETLAESYTNEMSLAVDIAKAYFGDIAKSFYVNWKGASGPVKYKPNETFSETDQAYVRWAMPGSDINSLTVAGGQRVQMKTLAREDFMEIDPMVDDVEQTKDRIAAQDMYDMLPMMIQADLQSQLLTGMDVANMMQEIASNKLEPWDAYNAAHAKAQKRQADQQAAAAAAPGSPDAQPGVTQPGEGATGSPIEGEFNQGLQGLAQLNNQLRGPMRPVPAGSAAPA